MAASSDIDVYGVKLRVQRGGRGEPLLFLHGAQGIAGWEPAFAALARQFDVIAPDHPGFGRSPVSDQIDDVPELALLYLDLIKVLGLSRVHVVGHCIGGWTAMEMAIRSTSAMQSLVLAASAGLRLEGIPRADMFIYPQDELGQLLFAGNEPSGWLQAWRASPEQEDIYDRNRAAAARFCWQPRLCNPKLARWLHRIDVPTHIIWGEGDKVIPPAYAKGLQERIESASVTMIPACGHLPHVEKPAEFATIVSDFIRKAAP
jgi:pimeloyl-ACP methyl ester carboxylesterase